MATTGTYASAMVASAAKSEEEATILLDLLARSSSPQTHFSAGGLRCRVDGVQRELPATYDQENNRVACRVPQAVANGTCAVLDAEGKLVCGGGGGGAAVDRAATTEDDEGPDAASDAAAAHKDEDSVLQGLSLMDRLLALWIIAAMVVGVVLGYYVPSAKEAFESVKVDSVSLPVAVGLWGMMWPVLAKVRYEVLGGFARRRDSWVQLGWSVLLNWAVGPLLMTGLAWATLPDVPGYRNGVIIVGIARCIAMVLIWNQLARGDAEYCALLVAVNSILQMVLFAPYAVLLLQVVSRQYLDGSGVGMDFWAVCRSVLIFLGAPLVAGVATRFALIAAFGERWYTERFLPWFGPLALLSLLYTIVVLFALQGHQVIAQIGDVCRIAVPLALYFVIMWSATFALLWRLGYPYTVAVTQAFTGSSNNFELAIAIAAGTFGSSSPEALAATIGPLIEVPALLALVHAALWLRPRLAWKA